MTKVLLTGSGGFLGRNVLPLLREEFGEVVTLGRSKGNDVCADLSAVIPKLPADIDVVVHAAGRAHIISENEAASKQFYDVNVQGTINLCKALEQGKKPRALVFVSSVAVYGCESGDMIDENHPLQGASPYALSKIEAERFLKEWCEKNGVVLTVLRPALIYGDDAPGNLGAMMQSLRKGYYFNISGNKARRSMVTAHDVGSAIVLSAGRAGIYNLCSNEHPTVVEFSEWLARHTGSRRPMMLPRWIAAGTARIGDVLGGRFPLTSLRLKKITTSLTFSNRKAVEELGWRPRNVIE